MRPVRQQLRRSLGWLAVSGHLPRHRRRSSSFVTSSGGGESAEPLRILFFGSDDFSTASLRGLDGLRAERPGLIESVDVATLLPKPVGRGLKQVRHRECTRLLEDKPRLPTFGFFPREFRTYVDENG